MYGKIYVFKYSNFCLIKNCICIKVPFPAITICPQNIFEKHLDNTEEFLKIKEDLVGQICPELSYIYKSGKESYMKNITYDIAHWARQFKPNASEAFNYCEMHNYEKNCLGLIAESFTSHGLCFTINRLSFKDLYRDDV